jgi:DNA-directed RNA polymerase specialized sigma24 family protein
VEGLVLFGDVVRSRRSPGAATAWLRLLRRDLTDAYEEADRLARFEFTQGDEIQGLLAPSADPIPAVLRAALHPERREMRWVIVRGAVDAGEGPATQRSGPAFIAARERLELAAARREAVAAQTGNPATDRLLDGVAPAFGELLGDLTPRQRQIGWQLLVEGLRQSEVAARLGVSRATISVAADRAHLRAIADLGSALAALIAAAPGGPG